MPNWSDTTYKCVGDAEEVNALYNIIKGLEQKEEPVVENGFGNLWLGCVIHQMGLDWKNYQCRGEIYYYELTDPGLLMIDQETAWGEQEGFRKAIEEKYPSIKVYYADQEPGFEVYCTNDTEGRYFPERYYLDCMGDSDYYVTLEDAAARVSGIVGYPVQPDMKAIEKALTAFEDTLSDPHAFYKLHEFEVVKE